MKRGYFYSLFFGIMQRGANRIKASAEMRKTYDTNGERKMIGKERKRGMADIIADENLYLFLSIDLSDSTIFKTENPLLWKKTIIAFYQAVFEAYGIEDDAAVPEILKNCDLNLWKLVGDEVLLYIRVKSASDIGTLLDYTEDTVERLPEKISEIILRTRNCSKEQCEKGLCLKHCEYHDERLTQCRICASVEHALGAKATMWAALCGDPQGESRNSIYRMSLRHKDSAGSFGCDFLGPDLDEGFRLGKYAVKSRVIISPMVAALMRKAVPTRAGNMKIISYQVLKGIWKERQYPVILYSQDMKGLFARARYDELDMPVYKHIQYDGDYSRFLVNPAYDYKQICKIVKEVHLDKEVGLMEQRLEDSE